MCVARPKLIERATSLVVALAAVLLARRLREHCSSPPFDDSVSASELDARSRDDRAATILSNEYTFVSGLIPFYRRVEIGALGGTGTTIAALLAFIGVLETAADPDRPLEATILSLAALVPLVLLLLELMALMRIMRASAYIRRELYPLAVSLTSRPRVLRWEFSPTQDLLESIAVGREPGPSPRFAKLFASSAPVITAIVLAAVGLPLAGVALDPSDWLAPARLVGYAAAAIAFAIGSYAILSTLRFETRSSGAAAPSDRS